MANTLRQGAVALRTGGLYCAHIYSELDLGCCGGPGAVAAKGVQRARQCRQLKQGMDVGVHGA